MGLPRRDLRIWLLLPLCVWATFACVGGGQPDGLGETRTGAAIVGGDVVSTVDGHPITIEQVERLARAGGLSPRAALRRLQAERLLMGAAERRGLRTRSPVRTVARRARVQALLDERAAAVQVEDAELRRRYESAADRFHAPERRASVHVLAQLQDDATEAQAAAARAYVAAMVDRLQGEEPPEALIEELHGRQEDGFTVVVQKLPAVPASVSFDQPYLDALFGPEREGVYPDPVRTSFGWHALRITEIIPALDVSFEDARDELREEALLELRSQGVRAFIDQLRSETPVAVQDGAREAMASLRP